MKKLYTLLAVAACAASASAINSVVVDRQAVPAALDNRCAAIDGIEYAPAKAAPVNGQWNVVGTGTAAEGFLYDAMYEMPMVAGQQWEITIEQSASDANWYRTVFYNDNSPIVELLGEGHAFAELLVFARGGSDAVIEPVVLFLYLFVLGTQFLVLFVETVDFLDVVTQQGTQGLDLVLELGYLGRAFVFLIFEFGLQGFDLKTGVLVFFGEVTLDGVVHYHPAGIFEDGKFAVEVLGVIVELLLLVVELHPVFFVLHLLQGFMAGIYHPSGHDQKYGHAAYAYDHQRPAWSLRVAAVAGLL